MTIQKIKVPEEVGLVQRAFGLDTEVALLLLPAHRVAVRFVVDDVVYHAHPDTGAVLSEGDLGRDDDERGRWMRGVLDVQRRLDSATRKTQEAEREVEEASATLAELNAEDIKGLAELARFINDALAAEFSAAGYRVSR